MSVLSDPSICSYSSLSTSCNYTIYNYGLSACLHWHSVSVEPRRGAQPRLHPCTLRQDSNVDIWPITTQLTLCYCDCWQDRNTVPPWQSLYYYSMHAAHVITRMRMWVDKVGKGDFKISLVISVISLWFQSSVYEISFVSDPLLQINLKRDATHCMLWTTH